MDRRQSLFEILFVAASLVYFGVRIGLSDSIDKLEGDVLRPIELAQSEGMKERVARVADEVLSPELSAPEQGGDGMRSLASVADVATNVRVYASPLLKESFSGVAGELDRHVFRRRSVVPDERLLREKIAALTRGERLAELSNDYRSLPMNLFPDAELVGVIDGIEPSLKGGYVLLGHVQGEKDSSLAMVFENNILIADMAVGRDRYELRYLRDTHVVQQIDSSRVDDVMNLGEVELLDDVMRQTDGAGAAASGIIQVDITYSSPVKVAQGSRASVEGRLQLAAARANEQLAKSGSQRRIHLTSMKEGAVAMGEFLIMAADTSAKAKIENCGLEILQDEETVWPAGEMVEVRWYPSGVTGPLEMSLISPDGSVQSLGVTENDGQIHILAPRMDDSDSTDGYLLRLQSTDGCVVESRSIRIR